MSFIPEDNHSSQPVNLTPLIDFVFLLLVVFASLAVSRIAVRQTEIELAGVKPATPEEGLKSAEEKLTKLFVSINRQGEYKWHTSTTDYPMATSQKVCQEIMHQYQKGLLSKNKSKTLVLLRIDKHAPWDSVFQLIHAIDQCGFKAKPLYETPKEN